jgi:hypothetical protein
MEQQLPAFTTANLNIAVAPTRLNALLATPLMMGARYTDD